MGPDAEFSGLGEVDFVETVCIILKHVGVGGKAACRSKEDSFVFGRYLEEALIGLQTEWNRFANELRVVVRGVNATTAGKCVTDDIHCHLLDRACG